MTVVTPLSSFYTQAQNMAVMLTITQTSVEDKILIAKQTFVYLGGFKT